MDNRKRARLEALPSAATTTNLATLGGQSIFLSNSSIMDQVGMGGQLPPNVFLTICDEPNSNSDEEEEEDEATGFLTIDSSELELAGLALPQHIKQEHQEHEIGTQTTPPPSSQVPPLQYRLVHQNQLNPTRPSVSGSSTSLVTLPTSGCEIYLVKEYVAESALPITAKLLTNASHTTTPTAAIKMEPDVQFVPGCDVGANVPSPCLITPKVTTPVSVVAPTTLETTTEEGGNRKRSFILEAYKKRDDKRRATHNEVERRRRDKINSWIFKLKEMLPPEMPNSAESNAATNCDSVLTATVSQLQQQKTNVSNNNNSNSRTPPSDSKSQILIKACEYIKAMQQEIKSLRECLSENEHLRLSNQRLQTELHKLKNERGNSQQQQFNVVTLNSLNGNSLFGVVNGVVTGTGAATLVATAGSNGSRLPPHTNASSYAKRELIIRDYVD